MTKKQIEQLKEGELIILNDNGYEIETTFKKKNIKKFSGEDCYFDYTAVIHFDQIRKATEKDLERLIKKATERYERSIAYLKKAYELGHKEAEA